MDRNSPRRPLVAAVREWMKRTDVEEKESLRLAEALLLHAHGLKDGAGSAVIVGASLAQLAAIVHCNERTVRRHLDALEASGHLVKGLRQGQRPRTYTLHRNASRPDIRPDTEVIAEWTNGLLEWTFQNSEWTFSGSRVDTIHVHLGFDLGLKHRVVGESKPDTPVLRTLDQVLSEIEAPEKLIEQITADGLPVTRNEVCGDHGPFVRKGWLWGNWIAWAGLREIYGTGFSEDAGCVACRTGQPQHLQTQFELLSPLKCPTHGAFVSNWRFYRYTDEFAQRMGRRFEMYSTDDPEICPDCEFNYEQGMLIQDTLELSPEEWERGGKQIMEAVYLARGWSQ